MLLIKLLLLCVTLQPTPMNIEGPTKDSEKIVLLTDRVVYIAGENLLYNLFLLDSRKKTLVSYPSIGYVTVRDKYGSIAGKSLVKIIKGKADAEIYLPDTLKTGYYQVVAYTNFMRNGPEDNFGEQTIIITNRFDANFTGLSQYEGQESDSDIMAGGNRQFAGTMEQNSQEDSEFLTITSNQLEYNKREKVKLKIEPAFDFDQPVNVTISVVEENRFEKRRLSNKTDGNTSFWNTKPPEITRKPDYLAENKYQVLEGKIKRISNDRGFPGRILYLSSPDTIANLQYAVTDRLGYFRFPLSDYYNGRELFIKVTESKSDDVYEIEIDPKFNAKLSFCPPAFIVDSSFIKYLARSQEVVRVRKSYGQIASVFDTIMYNQIIPRVYYKADIRVYPADYAELVNFVEIAREILPFFKVRKENNEYQGEMFDFNKKTFLKSEPLIFLDGVLTDNINQVIGLGTRDIKKIDLIASEWVFGELTLPGVIAINSSKEAWRNVPYTKDNIRMKMESYFKIPSTKEPDYSIVPVESREPDFRQLLYWAPSVRLSGNSPIYVEFFTSDYAAPYTIKIIGIGPDGRLIRANARIEVVE
jgi:hypothetical protein